MSEPEVSQEVSRSIDRKIHAEVDRVRPSWYGLAVSVGASVLSALLAAVIAISVSRNTTTKIEQQRAETDRKWCQIVVPLDERQRTIENPQPAQVEFARAVSDMRAQLHCPPTKR